MAVPAGHALQVIEPRVSVYVPVPQLEQFIILKVALPSGHCKQVAEPAAETAPPGQVVQAETKTEK